jgi:hypothetical protein
MKAERERRAEERRKSVRLHLEEEHLIAVGHVAIRAGMLDKMIEMTAEQIIIQLPKTLREEAFRLSTGKKLQLIKDALIDDMPESQCAIAEFISEISSARSERNDIIHRIWRSTEAADTKELVVLRRGAPEKAIRRVTAKSMMALATRMIDLTFEMADWKVRTTVVRQRRFGLSLGIRPVQAPPPSPPRTSPRDLERQRQRASRQRDSRQPFRD